MAERAHLNHAMFPTLSADQIARLVPLGVRRRVAEGEVILDPGMVPRGLYLVLAGRLEVVSSSRTGEVHITALGRGQFTGEVNILTGRPSLVRTRAAAPSELLEVNHGVLRHIVQTDPELGEIFLRAFVRRRARLIAEALGDLILLGSRYSARLSI
jgi:thioredoxin reductase (NADPH)